MNRQVNEEELNRVAGGMSDNNVSNVMVKVSKLRREGVISEAQMREILSKAGMLSEYDYGQWANDYALEHGFGPNLIMP